MSTPTFACEDCRNSTAGVCGAHSTVTYHVQTGTEPQPVVRNTIAPRIHRPSSRWASSVPRARIYRLAMRVMHRWGWCFPEHADIDERYVWCHWCGMRGTRPLPPGQAVAKMRAAMERKA